MGQDVSIVFCSNHVNVEKLTEIAAKTYAKADSENLALLYSYSGPACVQATFSEFTSVSVWEDAEASLVAFAKELSRAFGRALILTMADHALVGAWRLFKDGKEAEGDSIEGVGYAEIGIPAIETAFGVRLEPDEDERLFFVESFIEELFGVCVFGSAGGLKSGAELTEDQILAILECDLDGVDLECALYPG